MVVFIFVVMFETVIMTVTAVTTIVLYKCFPSKLICVVFYRGIGVLIKKLRKKAAASVRPTVKLDKVLKVFNINYIFLNRLSGSRGSLP